MVDEFASLMRCRIDSLFAVSSRSALACTPRSLALGTLHSGSAPRVLDKRSVTQRPSSQRSLGRAGDCMRFSGEWIVTVPRLMWLSDKCLVVAHHRSLTPNLSRVSRATLSPPGARVRAMGGLHSALPRPPASSALPRRGTRPGTSVAVVAILNRGPLRAVTRRASGGGYRQRGSEKMKVSS